MTKESASQTEPWIESHEAGYAYAYDKGGKLGRWFGVGGIPHAILVDPTGTIAWRGHPAGLEPATVSGALKGALRKPVWEWPRSADKVRKAYVRGKLGKAIAEAEALGAEGAELLASLREQVAGQVRVLQGLYERGDFLTLSERGEACLDGLEDLPEVATVEELLAKLDDDLAEDVIKAQRKIRDIFADDVKKSQIRRHERTLSKILEELPGTYAAEQAQEGLKKLAQLENG